MSCFPFQRGRQRRYVQLIREALTGLLTVVDRDAQIDSIDLLLSLSEEESVWVDLCLAMVDVLSDDEPMSSVLISFLLETFALPSMETTLVLSHKLVRKCTRSTGKLKPNQCRNIAIIWSMLAAKLAGKNSAQLLTDETLQVLLSFLKSKHPVVQLHTLIALEKFSMTSENKERILNSDVVKILLKIESDPIPPGDKDLNFHQVQFSARWSLDNIFPSVNRDFSLDSSVMMNINVMLNKSDTTDFLKLSRQGLEARNDATTFESVRGTTAVTEGCWFYEVTICTSGILQIGWATKHCLFESESGNGIGDDANSISYDGCRRRIWHRGYSEEYGSRSWKAGDVVGVLLDIDDNFLAFMLNGENMGDALRRPERAPNLKEMVHADEGLYPAASFMAYQHCIFNFGHKPFSFPPLERFKPLNSIGRLTHEQKNILPKLAQRQLEVVPTDDAVPKCQICYDHPPDSILLPCQHTGFCFKCALQCEICPICRTGIEQREPIDSSQQLPQQQQQQQ